MGGAGMEVELIVNLQDRPDLLEKAALLLNRQWPRSLEARKHSIEDSCDELPCSLLLVVKSNDEVIGHVRVLGVDGCRGGAIVESLVVSPDMRRRGLGRRLMEAAEEYVKRRGYNSMHLSTHDQHTFYQRLGYRESTPVTAIRKCTAQFTDQDMDISDTEDSPHNESIITHELSTTDPPVTQPIAPPPPAPPPPPSLPSSIVKESNNDVIKWYKKVLKA